MRLFSIYCRHPSTKDSVFEALDAEVDNGYVTRSWGAEEIADDLTQYVKALEGIPPASLVPFVDEWRKKET